MNFRVITGLAIIAGSSCAATPATGQPPCPKTGGSTVLIQLFTGNVGIGVTAQAESVAAKILSAAGVWLRWAPPRFPAELRRCASLSITIELDTGTPYGLLPRAWAYATPFASSGTTIHIFWDRLTRIREKELWAPVLGHILAHEITHVLQHTAWHSGEGLMKARWQPSDFTAMAYRPLSLSADDIDLIHRGLATLSEEATPTAGDAIAGH